MGEFKSMKKGIFKSTWILGTALLVSQGARAEDAQPVTGEKAQKSDKLEKVTVTGSYIKRIDGETVQPVQIITREELDRTASNNLADALRSTLLFSNGVGREVSNVSAGSNPTLRGKGVTLFLLNGIRFPNFSSIYPTSMNMIPMAAIERIEILKDGASALYGSDATAGVINFITRKDFDGLAFQAQQTIPDSLKGPQTLASAVYGTSFPNGTLLAVVNGTNAFEVMKKDRSWSLDPNSFSTSSDYPAVKGSSGGYKADAACPTSYSVSGANTRCKFYFNQYMSELPELKQVGGLLEGNYNITNSTKLTGRFIPSYRYKVDRLAPSPGTFTLKNSVIDTFQNLPSGWVKGQSGDGTLSWRVLEAGNRVFQYDRFDFSSVLGSATQIGNSWELTSQLVHGEGRVNYYGSGWVKIDALTTLLNNGKLQPFVHSGANDYSAAKADYWEKELSRTTGVEVRGAGELFNGWAGPISMAVGSTFYHQGYYYTNSDDYKNGNILGSSSSGETLLILNTGAAFSELSIPLIEKRAELQLAGRYDQFSNSNTGTTNPKAGLMIRPMDGLMIRGGYGSGFVTPDPNLMTGPVSAGYPSFIDEVACAAEKKAGGSTPSCVESQWYVEQSPNPALKPTTSKSYSADVAYEPNNTFRVSGGYYLLQQENEPKIDLRQATLAELTKGSAYVASQGVTIARDNTGYIDTISYKTPNASTNTTSGIDLEASAKAWGFGFKVAHNYVLSYEGTGFPGLTPISTLGWWGIPRWRNNASIDYSIFDKHKVTVFALTTGPQFKTAFDGNIDTFTSFDVKYEADFKKWGVLTASVRNILNTIPPLDSNANTVFNYQLYDPGLRTIDVSYKVKF